MGAALAFQAPEAAPIPSPPRGLTIVEFAAGEGGQIAIFTFPVSAQSRGILTPAERAVVTAILDGKSNAAIALARSTSVRTVANQVASIFKKLGVGSRAELVATHAAFDQ